LWSRIWTRKHVGETRVNVISSPTSSTFSMEKSFHPAEKSTSVSGHSRLCTGHSSPLNLLRLMMDFQIFFPYCTQNCFGST
jgi:hypothetical protein